MQWEFIGAASTASFSSGKIHQLPIADVSLGLVENTLQIAATYQYVIADDDALGSESDFGSPQVSLKWQFWRNDEWQLAFAPLMSFGITSRLAELGIGNDTNLLQLPLVAERQLDCHWRLNTSIAYVAVDSDVDAWNYSAALSRRVGTRWELMAELVGGSNEDFDDSVLDVRAGFDLAVTQDLHLLLSAATGLNEPSRADRLHYEVYVGLQYFY